MQWIDLKRRQLLTLAGGGLLTLAGCGGGGDAAQTVTGGSDSGGGGGGGGGGGSGSASDFAGEGAAAAGTPGTAVTAAQRVAALNEVTVAVAGLLQGGAEPRFDALALARRLQAMPALQRVGLSSTTQNLWARFTDGRVLVVPNNLAPTAAPSAASAPAGRAQALSAHDGEGDLQPALLTARQYRQLDMLGEVPNGGSVEAAHLHDNVVSAATLPRLRRLAGGRGFTLPEVQVIEPPDVGIDNGVDGLRQIRDDGVFFITACAAQVGNDATPRTVICTDTAYNEASEQRYANELGFGTLTYAVTLRGVEGAWVPRPVLAVAPEFALDNGWRFPTECIAVFNLSGGAVLGPWIQVLLQAGLNHLMTWDRPVSWQRMLAFADDLFQLSLASNRLDGSLVRLENQPRLRAYGVGETLEYLDRRGLTDDAAGQSAVSYLQAPPGLRFVNTLLPTIDYVTFREGEPLIEFVGLFGARADGVGRDETAQVRFASAPGTPSPDRELADAADAAIGNAQQALPDPLWKGDLLQAPLRSGELAGGGYVQVFNGGRWSNHVAITHWRIPLRAVQTIDALTLALDFVLHLRADVRPYRMGPEGFARNGQTLIGLSTTLASNAQFTASGEISRTEGSVTTTVSWSGSGSVGNAPGQVLVKAAGVLDWQTRRMGFTLSSLAGAHAQRTLEQRNDPELGLVTLRDETIERPATLQVAFSASGPLEFAFDTQWRLLAGGFDLPAQTVSLLGTRQLRTRLEWQAVAADFPPRDDLGGT
jgi:hypothetical protein